MTQVNHHGCGFGAELGKLNELSHLYEFCPFCFGQLKMIETAPGDNLNDIERWWKELNDLMNQPHDPDDVQRLECALDEADTAAKDHLRREMGLN